MILTNGLFDEFEKLATDAKNDKYVKIKEMTIQHSDYELLECLIKTALELGKLKNFKINK